jgi:hypothetical protein
VLDWKLLPSSPQSALLSMAQVQNELETERGKTTYFFGASLLEHSGEAERWELSQRFMPTWKLSLGTPDLLLLEQRSLIKTKKRLERSWTFSLTPYGRSYENDQNRAGAYARTAIQYYLLGRWGVLSGLLPVAPVLFHHALELLLKMPYAASGLSDRQIMDRFGNKHDLMGLWNSFRVDVANDDSLNRFYMFVDQLNHWEGRYDTLWSRGTSYHSTLVRHWCLCQPSALESSQASSLICRIPTRCLARL